MYFRMFLLMTYYMVIMLIFKSDYLYDVKIKPLQWQIYKNLKTVMIWVILSCSVSLIREEDMRFVFLHHVIVLVFALIWFCLDYESSRLYYFNGSKEEEETVIAFIDDHMQKSGFTSDEYEIEVEKIFKSVSYKIQFENISRSKIKKGVQIFLLECKENIPCVKKRKIFNSMFFTFIIINLIFGYMFMQLLNV